MDPLEKNVLEHWNPNPIFVWYCYPSMPNEATRMFAVSMPEVRDDCPFLDCYSSCRSCHWWSCNVVYIRLIVFSILKVPYLPLLVLVLRMFIWFYMTTTYHEWWLANVLHYSNSPPPSPHCSATLKKENGSESKPSCCCFCVFKYYRTCWAV